MVEVLDLAGRLTYHCILWASMTPSPPRPTIRDLSTPDVVSLCLWPIAH